MLHWNRIMLIAFGLHLAVYGLLYTHPWCYGLSLFYVWWWLGVLGPCLEWADDHWYKGTDTKWAEVTYFEILLLGARRFGPPELRFVSNFLLFELYQHTLGCGMFGRVLSELGTIGHVVYICLTGIAFYYRYRLITYSPEENEIAQVRMTTQPYLLLHWNRIMVVSVFSFLFCVRLVTAANPSNYRYSPLCELLLWIFATIATFGELLDDIKGHHEEEKYAISADPDSVVSYLYSCCSPAYGPYFVRFISNILIWTSIMTTMWLFEQPEDILQIFSVVVYLLTAASLYFRVSWIAVKEAILM